MGNKYQDEDGRWWHELPCGHRYKLHKRTCTMCGVEDLVVKHHSTKLKCKACSHIINTTKREAGNYYDKDEQRWYYWNPSGFRIKLYKRRCVGCYVEDYVRKELLENLCFSCANTGEKNPNWTGGSSVCPYVFRLLLEHPHCNESGYVMEHRAVMEDKIGRYLLPEEIVHHINYDKRDNRPENLWLFPNRSEHMKWHWWLNKRERLT